MCGAAPLLMDGKRLVERAPPAAAGAARTPLLVVVGGQERSAARWEELGPRWAAAGVQLTLRVVPGEGHALLFDRQAEEDLLRWLEERRGGALRTRSSGCARFGTEVPRHGSVRSDHL